MAEFVPKGKRLPVADDGHNKHDQNEQEKAGRQEKTGIRLYAAMTLRPISAERNRQHSEQGDNIDRGFQNVQNAEQKQQYDHRDRTDRQTLFKFPLRRQHDRDGKRRQNHCAQINAHIYLLPTFLYLF